MSDKVEVPSYDQLFNPVLESLKRLGGSGTIEEIHDEVAEMLELSEEQLSVLQDPERGSRTKFSYNLAWTRTYLKKYGVLENSSRGVWALTPLGRETEWVEEREVVRTVREMSRGKQETVDDDQLDEPESEETWRDDLIETLLQMEPSAFERLIQRLLRESGFIQVEVTGRSGDGGIDGIGIMRLGGLLSFHVIFQCKRWQGSVPVGVVRDFRGAMVGRADKGLLVTTGTFTKDAVQEATRDGAPAIDLIDGETLLDKLKELSLGVKTEKVEVENVEIDHDWFLRM